MVKKAPNGEKNIAKRPPHGEKVMKSAIVIAEFVLIFQGVERLLSPPMGISSLYGDFLADFFFILIMGFFLYVGAYVSYYFLIRGTFYGDRR